MTSLTRIQRFSAHCPAFNLHKRHVFLAALQMGTCLICTAQQGTHKGLKKFLKFNPYFRTNRIFLKNLCLNSMKKYIHMLLGNSSRTNNSNNGEFCIPILWSTNAGAAREQSKTHQVKYIIRVFSNPKLIQSFCQKLDGH